jgi:hypothetical protein
LLSASVALIFGISVVQNPVCCGYTRVFLRDLDVSLM